MDAASRNHHFINRSVKWMINYFNISNTTEIVDFGCGPGLYASRLAENGAKVTGIDFSKNSLEFAKKNAAQKGLDIDYIHMNYLKFDTEKRFDLIIMIMCDFCALSLEQRRILLSKLHSLLKPRGSILLDVYTLNSFEQRQESASYELNQLNGFWSPDDYYCFVNTFKYDSEKVILDKYTIVEPKRTRTVYNWLQHYSRESLAAEFKSIGFNIKDVFSDVSGKSFDTDSPEMAVIAAIT